MHVVHIGHNLEDGSPEWVGVANIGELLFKYQMSELADFITRVAHREGGLGVCGIVRTTSDPSFLS